MTVSVVAFAVDVPTPIGVRAEVKHDRIVHTDRRGEQGGGSHGHLLDRPTPRNQLLAYSTKSKPTGTRCSLSKNEQCVLSRDEIEWGLETREGGNVLRCPGRI